MVSAKNLSSVSRIWPQDSISSSLSGPQKPAARSSSQSKPCFTRSSVIRILRMPGATRGLEDSSRRALALRRENPTSIVSKYDAVNLSSEMPQKNLHANLELRRSVGSRCSTIVHSNSGDSPKIAEDGSMILTRDESQAIVPINPFVFLWLSSDLCLLPWLNSASKICYTAPKMDWTVCQRKCQALVAIVLCASYVKINGNVKNKEREIVSPCHKYPQGSACLPGLRNTYYMLGRCMMPLSD